MSFPAAIIINICTSFYRTFFVKGNQSNASLFRIQDDTIFLKHEDVTHYANFKVIEKYFCFKVGWIIIAERYEKKRIPLVAVFTLFFCFVLLLYLFFHLQNEQVVTVMRVTVLCGSSQL